MEPLPLPAPYGGVNERVPKIGIESPFCEYLYNFNVSAGGISLRNGDSKYSLLNQNAGGSTPTTIVSYSDSKCWVLGTNADGANHIGAWNVDTGVIDYTSGIADQNYPFETLYHKNYIYFYPYLPTGGPFHYTGAAWGTGAFTGPSSPYGGDSYKGRAYVIDRGSQSAWYGPSGGVTGTLVQFDMSSICQESYPLVIICPVTIADTVQATTYQTFIFSNGEVLFYGGAYPDSNDWQLIGRGKISQPLDYGAYISYQGDSLILCDTGVISMRDLFLKGSESAASLTVSAYMQRTWQALVKALRSTGNATGPVRGSITGAVRGVWDPKNDRIIISFPGYVDTNGTYQPGSFYFVLYNQLTSWYFHRSFGPLDRIYDICRYKNKILMIANGTTKMMVYEKEGASNFTDRGSQDASDVAFDYDMISAPISGTGSVSSGSISKDRQFFTANPGGTAYTKRCVGLDMIMKSDLYGQTNFQLLRDFGVQSTTAQKIPDQGSGLQKPYANIGIEGTYIQYRMYGTTTAGKSTGLELYGSNVWLETGGSPR